MKKGTLPHGYSSLCKQSAICIMLIVLLVGFGPVNAQTIPSVSWMRLFGSTTGDMGQSVSARQDIYLTGYTVGAFPGQTFDGIYFDPWGVKFNAEGEMQWVDQYGTGTSEGGYAIVNDISGVYTVGYINGGNFPGQPWYGGQDYYIRKHSHDGIPLWTRQFGTTGHEMIPGAITVDATGVYTCGKTSGAFTGFTFAGGEDMFFIKYSYDGDFLWCHQEGTEGYETCNGIFADNTGLYICGASTGNLFGQTNTSQYYNDAYIARYTSDGDLVWAHLFGTPVSDIAYEIYGDESGIYISGSTGGTFPGQTYSGGSSDAFVAKFDRDGNQLWLKEFGTTGTDYGYGVSLNTSGVFVAGNTTGTFPGQTTAIGNDIYIAKLDKAGNLNWIKEIGSIQRPGTTIVPQDYCYSVSVVSLTAYLAGYTNGQYTGVPGVGSSDALLIEMLVQTPPEATQDLITEVGLLVAAGVLNQGQGNSLIVKLQNSINKMNQGKYMVAINLLEAFINEVTDLNLNGIIPDKEAEELITAANRIISVIEDQLLKQAIVPEVSADEGFNTMNYPNPFNSSTTISYTIPDDLSVSLKVFDSRGTEVHSSNFGLQTKGSYSFDFTPEGLPNGLYYYRIQAGSYSAVRKLVLLK